MASNRPPSSRSRYNSTSIPAHHPRSRSVTAKSASSTRTPEEHESTPATGLVKQQKSAHSDEAETNIQVVVRCRRRSEREIQDNSPIIVSSNGARSTQVSIETTAPVSTLGVVTLPPVRTYPFDLVYGPEADQAMIYHDVVGPMLEQVLSGFNCTLFAYGQTGTGKTYTMQGDLLPTPMGNPSANAGMIPRVLFHLFHHLEKSEIDFSVKVSYIELYNEELRDLLASELAAPLGNTQPMGMASKDAAKNASAGIKIFDDANKRGVIIQGVEEIPVKNSTDALALLTKGSHRRQIAATKFNDHSSRSHSIFSLTIHTKETGVAGEDLLKVGKLNLVDLAGSENIGRSGAEEKRAREAGMINQSLLTLGRVINALVDKASHVPYRESKLTRILQDSLGGHTKTCIIATVSPARSNLEETLSTLDYAMCAKSIRNRPEVNQRMTRNSLLKEYVTEIERLKADVLAAREKNGIFFSEETWAQMSAEQEMKHTEMEEAKKQVEIIENQMRVVREEFEQSIGLLMKRDTELKQTKERLKDTETVLVAKSGELKGVKVALEEEIVVRQAFQKTESTLDAVATGLKAVAHDSIQDVFGLFDKLQRKSDVLHSNSNAVVTHNKKVETVTRTLSQKLDEFITSSSQYVGKLRDDVEHFRTREVQALAGYTYQVMQQLQDLQESMKSIHAQESGEREALAVLVTLLKETYQTFKIGFSAWGESLMKNCADMHAELDSATSTSFSRVESVLKAMHSLLESVVQETSQLIETEREAMAKTSILVKEAADHEVARLRAENQALNRLVERQKVEALRAKDGLLQAVSGLLVEYVNDRDRGLKDAISSIQRSNIAAEESMGNLADNHGNITHSMEKENIAAKGRIERMHGDAKRTRDSSFKALNEAKATINACLDETQEKVTDSVESYSKELQARTQEMFDSCNDAFDKHSRTKRARLELTTHMTDKVQTTYRSLHEGFTSISKDLEGFTGQAASEISVLTDITATYHAASKSHISTLQKATSALAEQGAREDVATGTTPRKRSYQYVDKWDLTESREHLLRARRDKGASTSGNNNTLLAEHVPLPEDDNGLEDVEMVEDAKTATPVPSESEGPATASLQSSTSSSSTSLLPPSWSSHSRQPSIPIAKKVPTKPPQAPLVDTRNVYTTRRSRRR